MRPSSFFLRILLAVALWSAAAASAQASAEDARPRPPYRVWFNHDGTNITGLVSPYHKSGQEFSEALFAASIDELGGKDIDAVAFSPGNGSIPWWQSKIMDHWNWYTKRTGRKPGAVGQYIMKGGDLVKVFVDHCRQQGLAPIITLRLKDEHGIDNLDSEWVSRFYLEHQTWRLDSNPRAVFGKRGLNWIYPAVPEERLAVLKELCESYDIDGVELDFMRFFPYFDVEHTTYVQRREVMTGFIKRVRELLDRTAKPGRTRYLSIRVPNRIAEFQDIGLDLGQLDRERLVDIVNISPSYVSQVESDVAAICAWAPQTAVFYEITHAAARGPSPSWGQFGDDYPIRITTDEQYYTAANLAYARGAAGISLFNFPYTRPSVRSGKYAIGGGIGREPPFHIAKGLRDPRWLATQSQDYWIPYWWKTGYNGRQFQLPQSYAVGTTRTLGLDLALPKTALGGARLRIRTAGGTPVLSATEPVPYYRGRPIVAWKARINGHFLTPTKDVSEPFEEPYHGFLGEPGDYAAWLVPAEVLHDGQNTITLELVNGPISEEFKLDVIWLDLAVFATSEKNAP